ncbi:protein TolR [Desulforhopalus singaporensis]|uniref:Cell division and transport-associated protein TolR n=1 Tax=Desulforhopalus singaporensis TaxID=91360 RepID=A0A1H0PXD3_9BACT|nr:protein TolR [Desulforhopalus singaporensis]SDP09148.1 Cell division and transport-associated protein TolR [Desulforhopalus singaporensis]
MGPTHRRGNKRLVSEINVTPLVDVMLVLLIIFMVTAPMMTQGLNVDLPETTAKSLRQEQKPLVITVSKDGGISIGSIPMVKALLLEELKKNYAANKDQPVYLRADRNVPYGDVVQIMAAIKQVGFDKIGMITKPQEQE